MILISHTNLFFIIFQPADKEKDASLDIINGILNKKPKLNVEKAVNKQIFEEQSE